MNKAARRHTPKAAATHASKAVSRKESKILSKKASKVVGRKASKSAARKSSRVLGVTSDGVRILKPKGRATHFTVPELEAAISRVRAARPRG